MPPRLVSIDDIVGLRLDWDTYNDATGEGEITVLMRGRSDFTIGASWGECADDDGTCVALQADPVDPHSWLDHDSRRFLARIFPDGDRAAARLRYLIEAQAWTSIDQDLIDLAVHVAMRIGI